MIGRARNIIILLCGLVFIGYQLVLLLSEDERDTYRHLEQYQTYAIDTTGAFYFCGEAVPLENPAVRQKLEKSLNRKLKYKNSLKKSLARAKKWFPVIEKILEEQGLPTDLKYVTVVESNLKNVVSPVGAAGFWQFMPKTAQSFGLKVNAQSDERYDPVKATYAACKYFKSSHKRLNNWINAIASFNMGVTGIKRAIRAQGKTSYFDLSLNKETSQYVYRILAMKEIWENGGEYDIDIAAISPYAPSQTRRVKIDTVVSDINQLAAEIGISVSSLKKYNPYINGENLLGSDTSPVYMVVPLRSKQKTSQKKSPAKPEKAKNENQGTGLYVIREDETIYSIASKHNTTVDKLLEWNKLKDTIDIAGKEIVVLQPKVQVDTTEKRMEQ